MFLKAGIGSFHHVLKISCVIFFSGLHQGVISAAVLVAIVLFAVVIGSTWLLYKRNSLCVRRLLTFGSAYYRQTSSQASDQDENVLLPDLETQARD